MKRLLIALAAALPGLALAMAAKPLVLGEPVLWLGILLAFGLPTYIVLRAQGPLP